MTDGPFQVEIAFSDGVEHRLEVAPGETVLDAALKAEFGGLFGGTKS